MYKHKITYNNQPTISYNDYIKLFCIFSFFSFIFLHWLLVFNSINGVNVYSAED